MHQQSWRSLMVGNSRWHWGEWVGDRLDRTWDDPQPPITWPEQVWAASVVPAALDPWRDRADFHEIHLADMPIAGLYPTLGIDRALAVWGAGQRYGLPAIAIDGGTALTLTAVDEQARLLGGAIAPGLGLQLRSLTEKTAALPPVLPPDRLPDLWACDSEGAIASGVAHGVTALVQRWLRAWRDRYPTGTAVLTGGDGPAIAQYLQAIDPELAMGLHCDPTVVFAGIAAVRSGQGGPPIG
jgi:type III pantothenate kinase